MCITARQRTELAVTDGNLSVQRYRDKMEHWLERTIFQWANQVGSINLHRGLYLYVLDKPRVDYTLARGTLRRGAQLGAIGVRPALRSSQRLL